MRMKMSEQRKEIEEKARKKIERVTIEWMKVLHEKTEEVKDLRKTIEENIYMIRNSNDHEDEETSEEEPENHVYMASNMLSSDSDYENSEAEEKEDERRKKILRKKRHEKKRVTGD